MLPLVEQAINATEVAEDCSSSNGCRIEKPFNDLDAWYAQRYSPERYCNAPAAVQIVGRKLQEESLLGMASVIQVALEDTTPLPRAQSTSIDERFTGDERATTRSNYRPLQSSL